MDLSSAIIVIKEKSLKVPEVKKIRNNYKLYYYFKQNHPGISAIICPNKVTTLQSVQFFEIEDNQSMVRGVFFQSKNKKSLIKVAIKDHICLYPYLLFF